MSATSIALAARVARSGFAQHATALLSAGSQQLRPFSSAPFEETRQVWRPPGMERSAPPTGAAREQQPAAPSTGTPASKGAAASAASPAAAAAAGAAPALSESFPEMDEVFQVLQDMELQPGRNCVVGDGLTVVDVALYLDGVQVAVQMQEQRPALSPASDPRAYALMRTMRSIMQAHGWHLVTLAAADWRRLDAEQRPHYLAHCINTALGGGAAGEQGHSHGHGHGHSHSHGAGGCGSGGCGHSHHEHEQPGHGHEHGAGGCGGGGGCGSKKQQGQGEHAHQHAAAGGGAGAAAGGGSCGGGGGCGQKH